MYKITVNGDKEFNLEYDKKDSNGTLNGEAFQADILKSAGNKANIIHNNKSYNVEVIEYDKVKKTAKIRVNSNVYTVDIMNEMDLLLDSLGMEYSTSVVEKELKAPMPGLVIETRVQPGDTVKEGDPLLVLEAMKMENVLKAPADVEIDEICVEAGQSIEKNTTLITYK